MLFLLLVAFISGLVTILAPCIWPLLPVILSASAVGGKRKSVGITLGIVVSFAILTLSISYLVSALKFDPNILRIVAVLVIGLLGITLIVPFVSVKMEALASRLTGKFGKRLSGGDSFGSGLVVGIALGIVWTPCAGPILATIATLAATRAVNLGIVLVTLVYVIGVGIPLFFFSIFSSQFFAKSQFLNKYTGRIQQFFGVIMVLTAILVYTNYDKVIETKLLDSFPSYSTLLNKLETTGGTQTELNKLKGANPHATIESFGTKLDDLGAAPDFIGITKWLNTDKNLSISDLQGKVVLVDFWTYTCVNCIRTLPFVTSWYEKYKDQGFVVIGVHTPEFEFEKNTQNVENAISQYKIHYPVAQDNDYKTWGNYNNQYWPAEYLIDANGHLRETHFGEGNYDKTEMDIKELLAEAGKATDKNLVLVNDQTPKIGFGQTMTPETYLGLLRIERFASKEKAVGGTNNYSLADNIPIDYFGYQGQWTLADEYAQASLNSSLVFNFNAKKVFIVITPKNSGNKIKVLLDGKPIDASVTGSDVVNGEVTLDNPRLYNLVNLSEYGNHLLQIDFENPGTQVFAFTFG